ncbi:hypothetical protein [Longilinea arvoryzae]|nr:hypothetical protein [Longilinea arvoryzae]
MAQSATHFRLFDRFFSPGAVRGYLNPAKQAQETAGHFPIEN